MAEPDPEAEIEVNLQAVCDGQTRDLRTLADLRRFLREYSDFYSFAKEDAAPANQQPFSIVATLVNTATSLVNYVGNFQANNNQRQQITIALNADAQICLPHPGSNRAQTVKRIWQDYGAKVGTGAAMMASNHNQINTIWTSHEAIKGALAYTLADPSLENTATKDAESGLTDALSEFEVARDQLYQETADVRRDLQTQTGNHESAFEQMQASFAVAIKGLAEEYDNRAAEAISSIKQTEATYNERMKLQASRQYWEEKATKHETDAVDARKRALGVLIFGSVFLAVLLFWLLQPWGNSQCDVSTVEALRQWLLPNASAIECPTYHTSLWSYLPRAAIGLILSTAYFWLSRLLVRLWLSEVHLGMDAKERVVMVDSYLALKNEGHIDDKDRAIILSPLFRPTQDGIVKDDAAVDPTTLGLMRLWQKN